MRNLNLRRFRAHLKQWYLRSRRSLPWRRTKVPYRIWVAEVMLQQTRVAAVTPYYERFLAAFPDVKTLAESTENKLLEQWSGLGYYNRARNLQKAARLIVARGRFPRDYASLRSLPGVGDYTAAAVASIAFGSPHAVVDGNVIRVLARLTGDWSEVSAAASRRRFQALANRLLDANDPGTFNQALMELGATVCLPAAPHCPLCPVAPHCEARHLGIQSQLPVKLRRGTPVRVQRTVLVIVRNGKLLLRRRTQQTRLTGFWELPELEQLPAALLLGTVGSFRHSIMNQSFVYAVTRATIRPAPAGFHWISLAQMGELPLSTATRKALAAAGELSRVLR